MSFGAIYDADVLIPHEIRDILMISASTRLHSVFWSDDIFAEWTRNAKAKELATAASVKRFQDIMNQLFPGALISRHRYEKLIDSMTNDKKDRHVLAAAVVAEVEVVVTNNLGDFPKDSLDPYNIEVQSPDEFVRSQAALNPRLFLEHFLRRAAQRNILSIERGHGELMPADLAMFLRDGPSNMNQTGQYILDLLES